MSTRTVNPWELDLRVRERNLASGLITDKDIEKHVTTLVDLAAETEKFATSQPALDEDDIDDEDEDEVSEAAEA